MGNSSTRALTHARFGARSRRSLRTRLAVLATAFAVASVTAVIDPTGVEPSEAASSPYCGRRIAKPTGGSWECTFVENFSGRQLDYTKWRPLTSEWTGAVKQECRVNTPNNVRVLNGTLRLTVRQEASPFVCNAGDTYYLSQYTAGGITSAGLFSQAYGRFEIRAKFPEGTVAGLHSAIWLWPQEMAYGPVYSGEIDIAEFRTALPDRVVPTVHYVDDGTPQQKTNWRCFVDRPDAFHRYVVEWTPETLTFLYDDQVCLVNDWSPAPPLVKPQPFDRPFFLILNQSLAGPLAFDPATAPLPGTMQVDWVRVWS